MQKAEIVLFQNDDKTQLDVLIENIVKMMLLFKKLEVL